MLRATWRSLLARKLRLLLASLAVLLGVSFVSGAFVLTDSLGRVFDDLLASINQNTSVTVRGVDPFGSDGLGSDQDREPLPQAVLDRVRAVPGVQEAQGTVSALAQLVLPDGKVLTSSGAPTIGVTMHAGSALEALKVKAGRAPVGPSEVAVDRRTATKQGLHLGDRVGILGKGAEQQATVVGLVGFADSDSLAGASLIALDGPTSQRLLGKPGTWTALTVSAQPGVSDRELRDRVAQVLPKGAEALTQSETVADSARQFKQVVGIFNTVLQVFAGVSLFVGMFLIFNTFAMLVAQRTRELALMRALGASRGQVTRSVLLEALVVGLVSSLGGFVVGIGLAVGLKALLGQLGIELPAGPTVVVLRTFLVSVVVGVLVTTAAALVPARRAAMVAPVQAMRESGPAEDRALTRRLVLGGLLLAGGAAALATGLSGSELPLVGVGAALTFVGVTVVSPLFARPVVRVLGWPLARLGVPGSLGRGNAMRSPRRTSATAAALMIGLALVAAISTLGSSVKKSVVHTVQTSLGADYVLHTAQYQGFSPVAAQALRGRPELAAVAGFRQGRAAVGRAGKVAVQGVDPAALREVLTLDVTSGSLSRLADGLAVSATEAKHLGVRVGDRVPVTWGRTGTHPLTVVAVYADNQFAGGYLVSDRTYDANVTDQQLVVVAVKAAAGTTSEQSRAAITQAIKGFPNLKVEDQAQFVKAQGKQVDTILNLILLLLGLSVLIAMLGIINTLALSVVERTRELGMLRAVGLQRRQLRLMIAAESVVIALFGALLGVGVGLVLGWALVQALGDQGITEFAVPWARIAVVLVVAALGGVLAAGLPARRAARMDVLEAVASP